MKKYNYIFISILISYILILIGLLIYFSLLQNYISIPACPIYKYLGIYCPACGGTRAVISLLHFDFVSSIMFNPIVIYTFFFVTLYLIIESINTIFNKKINISFILILKIGILILVINCIIKNLLLLLNKF